MKNKKIIVKLFFSIALITYIFLAKVDVDKIVEALSQAHLSYILVALTLHPLGLLISSSRWRLLLGAQGIAMPITTLFKSYLVCNFFNQFLPTQIGGDLVRAYDTRLMAQSGVKSFAIVFVERVSGISMLFLFALLMAVFRLVEGSNPNTQPIYLAGAFMGLFGLFAILMMYPQFPVKIVLAVLERLHFNSIARKIESFHQILRSYWEPARRGAFIKAFSLAFLLQMNVILYYFLLGLAFGLDQFFEFYDYMVLVPLVQVILFLPVSINGIGLREASWIGFFERFGIASATAFAFSILDFSLYLIFGIIGGLIYAFRK